MPAALVEFFAGPDVSPAFLEKLEHAEGADPWCWGFLALLPEEDRYVGTAGFHGPPDEHGVVEIAYAIIPECQNRGLATEAASHLIDFAQESGRVRQLVAHTLAGPSASTRILEKLDFTKVSSFEDPDAGWVDRWERRLVESGTSN